MLGKQSRSTTSTSNQQKKDRNRLQKSPRVRDRDKRLHSCEETLDIFRAQSPLTVFLCDEKDDLTLSDQKPVEPQTHIIAELLGSLPPDSLGEASSLYSKISTLDMEGGFLKRTRAKTPVFAVGQLEHKISKISEMLPIDTSRMLAEQYRALLPPRLASPFTEAAPSKSRHQTLRKIKCQQCLRSLIKSDPSTSSCSDSETLVGSESSVFPSSPKSELFGSLSSFEIHQASHDSDDEQDFSTPPPSPKFRTFVNLNTSLEMDKDSRASDDKEDPKPSSSTDGGVGLQIYLNLLTEELATAFFQQHPTEHTDRTSALQILLMIEAYESIQQRVRQELFKHRVAGDEIDHVRSLDRILNHWLQALYALYDHCREIECSESIRGDELIVDTTV
jgi:hypothetical protein